MHAQHMQKIYCSYSKPAASPGALLALQKRSRPHKSPLIYLKTAETDSLTKGGVEEEVLGYAEEETKRQRCGKGDACEDGF